MHRRSRDDEQWQALKKECKERDGGECRCCNILLPWEWKERQEQNDFRPDMTLPTDVAHCEPVSLHLDNAYDINNVFFLCRRCHSCIDNFYSPVDGHQLSANEHWYWWTRIRYRKTFAYDKDIDYEDLYNAMANAKEDTARKNVMDWW